MLFFFGTGTSTIGRYPLMGVACAYCGTLNSVLITIYSRYLHVFWIPVIPLGKHTVSQCQHCQQVLKDEQMPPAYRAPAQALVQQARTPVTNYLVLALAGVLLVAIILVGAFSSKHPATPAAQPAKAVSATNEVQARAAGLYSMAVDPAINEEFLAAPRVGDLYVVHNSGGGYTVMRVARVVPDTLYFQGSTYGPKTPATTNSDSVAKHLLPYFSPIPREGLRHMNETKTLTIVRK